MDPEERQQIFDAIAEKFDNLTATTSEGQDEELALFMAAQPGIIHATHEDGVVSGTFADGRGITLFKNFDPVQSGVSSLRGTSGTSIQAAELFDLRTASISLPETKKAVLMDGFTAEEPAYFKEVISEVRAVFEEDGTYDLEEQVLTVNNFRALRDVGVLYPAGHGGIRTDHNGRKYFVLVTSSLRTTGLDALFINDFLYGGLEYAGVDTSSGMQLRYAINENFLNPSPSGAYDNGITLAPNSLVYLPGCNGGSNRAYPFQSALFGRGAAVVVGWDRVVTAIQSIEVSAQFFDGVLGLSTAPGSLQNPPQRPFNYGDIIGDMDSRGVCARSGPPLAYPAHEFARLLPTFNPGALFEDGAGQLLPTITRIEVDEPSQQILVYGDFGGTVPQVLIEGQAMPINEFIIPTNIFAKLENASGPQSMGFVIASCDGRLSNPRLLSSWRGIVKLSSLGPSSLSREVSFLVHFRADLDTWRNQPGDLPAFGGAAHNGLIDFDLAPDSNGYVTCGGSHFDNDSDTFIEWGNVDPRSLSVHYSGQGPPPATGISGAGQIQLQNQKVYLQTQAVGITEVTRTPEGELGTISNESFNLRVDEWWFPWIEMSIDPDTWNIEAGAAQPVVDGKVTYTLTWEEIVCETGGPLPALFSR
jgi:hypothetical protein